MSRQATARRWKTASAEHRGGRRWHPGNGQSRVTNPEVSWAAGTPLPVDGRVRGGVGLRNDDGNGPTRARDFGSHHQAYAAQSPRRGTSSSVCSKKPLECGSRGTLLLSPRDAAVGRPHAATRPSSRIVIPRCWSGSRVIYLEKIPLENRSRPQPIDGIGQTPEGFDSPRRRPHRGNHGIVARAFRGRGRGERSVCAHAGTLP
jgi:hypothetical protein